jgi:methionyl-tRNA formyltransferase
MGSGSFSIPVLKALLEGGPQLAIPVETVGAVSQPDRPVGRGRKLTPNAVAALAREREIRLLQPRRLRERGAIAELADLRPDVIVVAAYGQILPARALAVPPCGCLNLHPSLLPRHRGPSPVIGTLLAGDARSGTTLMLMTEKMDAGPIISQIEIPVGVDETAGNLESRLARLSGELLLRDLPAWLNRRLQAQQQNEGQATYTRILHKEDARIDWRAPAVEIDRQIRAFDPWPVAYSRWRHTNVRLFCSCARSGSGGPGQVLGLEGDRLAIGTGDGIVTVAEIQLSSGRRLPASAVVRGHPALLGSLLE